MSLDFNDINDDDIRVISSDEKDRIPPQSQMPPPLLKSNRKKGCLWGAAAAIALTIVLVMVVFFTFPSGEKQVAAPTGEYFPIQAAGTQPEVAFEEELPAKGYVDITRGEYGGVPLTILTPRNAKGASLRIGASTLDDEDAILVVQAADVRADNGEIVGSYVLNGDLISRGESKSGFCAIIGGKPVVGVADATPYLEQAIESKGCFFRQYPLVVGGQIVENKLKNSSFRKALAELGDETVVVMSDTRLTLHDFSQALVDLGVTNAIYLIGSTAPGFAMDSEGQRVEFGKRVEKPSRYVNYILWK